MRFKMKKSLFKYNAKKTFFYVKNNNFNFNVCCTIGINVITRTKFNIFVNAYTINKYLFLRLCVCV